MSTQLPLSTNIKCISTTFGYVHKISDSTSMTLCWVILLYFR